VDRRTGRVHEPDLFQRHLVDGVVRGVGGYGNCVGVPNIGGETVFDDAYAGNPLVNVLAIGVLHRDQLQLARAEAPGHLAVLLGSATGRDGIGGASVLASQEFDEGLEAKRPNVQVGDPFAEKQLIECCLELYDRDLISGIQDMGAAGIACSTSELASAASMGMVVDLDAVHLREPSMASWEILCSESQERMLALVDPDLVDEVVAIAAKWGVPASVIGHVEEGANLRLSRGGRIVGDLPARSLADEGPVYDRPRTRPDWLDAYAAVDAESVDLDAVADGDLDAFVLGFLRSPNVASKRWVFEQYDQHVRSGTVLGPGMGDAGVVRLPDSRKAVACATDGNGRWCELDPREGTRRIVAEAFRNVACVGARPLGTTNCLNFGNPERPEIMWQLAESIAGMGEACETLGVPVTGGNVSLYNESRARSGDGRSTRSTRPRWSGSSGCWRTPRTPSTRASRTPATSCSCSARRRSRASPARSCSATSTCRSAGCSPRSTWTSRQPSARSCTSRPANGCCTPRTTCRPGGSSSRWSSRASPATSASRCRCRRTCRRRSSCSPSRPDGWSSACRRPRAGVRPAVRRRGGAADRHRHRRRGAAEHPRAGRPGVSTS
jgi:phosphoribosylformylglycinamidine (FGAM) synthase-like enzyme